MLQIAKIFDDKNKVGRFFDELLFIPHHFPYFLSVCMLGWARTILKAYFRLHIQLRTTTTVELLHYYYSLRSKSRLMCEGHVEKEAKFNHV